MAHKTFGWDAVKLSDHSLAVLHEIRESVVNDPANHNPDPNALFLYTKPARRKLDALGWAVFYKLKESKAA